MNIKDQSQRNYRRSSNKPKQTPRSSDSRNTDRRIDTLFRIVKDMQTLPARSSRIPVLADRAKRILDSFIKPKNRPVINSITDSMVEREVNGEIIKVKELENSEVAKEFLERNPGFSAVDEENGKVYVALSS